jgi:C_GCAxxG_C_C family probable redox protein
MYPEQNAIESFRSGLNCAQAVLTAFTNELGFDEDAALSISCGFGAGMGRLQETCGAVTGAYMVLGIHNCKNISDNNLRKAGTYPMVQKFSEKFKKIHGSTDCIDLLKCEIRTEEGHRLAAQNKLFETVCEKCISDSIEIISELISEKGR